MITKFFGVVLLGTLVVAEIPSYMKICGRRNPNLPQCVKDSVEGLRDKLKSGIPELDVPSLEPMVFPTLPLANTDQLKASATDVKFGGFSNFQVTDLKIDLENKQIDTTVFLKHLDLDADYDVKAKIVVPIQGRGPIHITTDDVEAHTTLKYKLIKKKNGGEYMFFPTMTTKLDIKDYTADFKPQGGPENDVLSTAVNAALTGGHKEVLESITPTLEKVISEEILRLANNICKHFTYDELFPDHE